MAEPGVEGAVFATGEDAETGHIGAPERVAAIDPECGGLGVAREADVGFADEAILDGFVVADGGAEELELLEVVAGDGIVEGGGCKAGLGEDGFGLIRGEEVLAGVDAVAAGVLGGAQLAGGRTGAGGLEGVGAVGGEAFFGHADECHCRAPFLPGLVGAQRRGWRRDTPGGAEVRGAWAASG
ncbi:MAG: hypothetical protein HY858_10060 [Candidatus Solibacter usitatus]|nr:hypothetical protein [Candidatus Solibacter usitatus]